MEATEGRTQVDRAEPADDAAATAGMPNLGRIVTRTPVLVVLFLVAAFTASGIAMDLPARARSWDFSHYYAATLALREGVNPYTIDLRPLGRRLGIDVGVMDRATYPPTFYLAFEPLTLLPPVTAYWLWIGLTTAALAAALYLMLGPASGLSTGAGLAATAIALTYGPIEANYYYAQCQILILLMIVAMVRLMERGRDPEAALMLALASLLRVFPVVLLGYFVVRRQWRIAAWAMLWGALGVLLTIGFVGWECSLGFLRAIPFITSDQFIRRPANVSLSGFVLREFAYATGNPHVAIILARRIVTLAAEVGVLALTITVTTARRAAEPDRDWRALGLWIVAMVMLSPTAWFHYFVLFLFVYALMIVGASRGRLSNRAMWAALASFVMVVAVQPIVFSIVTHHGADPGALLNYHPGPGAVALMTRAELSSLAMFVTYLAAYWFVVDAPTLAPAVNSI